MYAKKQIAPANANKPVRQKKTSKDETSAFSDNRPEALLMKKIQQNAANSSSVLQKNENKTGLPDNLKSGIENLSGYALDDVKVHYHSDKPAQLQAHAYAQGSDIHLAPGQKKHLPHEAWHVVQQKQGRVTSTRQMKGGITVNDDAGLEKEADVMGAKALGLKAQSSEEKPLLEGKSSAVVQQMPDWMLKLIGLAKENKLVVGGTVALGAAGILLYYYSKKKPGTLPPQIEEQLPEPTFETLKSLAAKVKIDPQLLINQLETGIGNFDVNDFYKTGIGQDQLASLLVPPNLLAGLPEEEGAKFTELLQRFHLLPFTYTGRQNSSGTGFLSRTGDCYTLANMFRFATVAAGIEGVEYNSDENPMLVPAASIHGRDTQGNVDGELCWAFDDHHWCEYKGTRYDLLFRRTGIHQISYRAAEKKHNEIDYSVFDNGRAIIYANMFDKLTTVLNGNHQGYVANNEDAIKEYIDTNKK